MVVKILMIIMAAGAVIGGAPCEREHLVGVCKRFREVDPRAYRCDFHLHKTISVIYKAQP